MAASGLLAILDDIGSMLDGGSGLEEIGAEKATKLAQGGLIDDVQRAHKEKLDIDHRHEMAVVMAVAKGALKNKLLYFIPTTFAIAAFAPWVVMPLCIGSGAYIAYEGVKRLESRRNPQAKKLHEKELIKASLGGKETLLRYEKEKISQAIKTDAALSLELTGFQVGVTAGAPLVAKLAVISAISIGATVALYATVLGIIGMNQLAHALTKTKGDTRAARAKRKIGRGLNRVSSPMMKAIAFVGMAALFFVGGHLLAAFIPGVPQALAAAGKAIVGVTSPWLAGPLSVGMDIATGLVGGVLSYTAIKSAKAINKFLKRRENGLYNRAVKKIKAGKAKAGRSGKTLCKAFAKVLPVKCADDNDTKAKSAVEILVLDRQKSKKPARRRRTPPAAKRPQRSRAAAPAQAPVVMPEHLKEKFSDVVNKPAPAAPAVNDNPEPAVKKTPRRRRSAGKKNP